MRNTDGLVLRALPVVEVGKPMSQAERDREANAYWDSLTEAQEVWALRKMGFFKMGQQPLPT